MQIGDTLRLSDLPTQEGVTYLDDPETVLASLAMPTRVEEPEEAAAEGEEAAAAEGEAPAEGEAQPEGEAAAGEQAEPDSTE
jgi:hypothetical protein